MIGRLIGVVTTQIIAVLLSPPVGLGLVIGDTDDEIQEVAS